MGLVAHACNPNYVGGLRFKASLGKYVLRPHLQNKHSKMDLKCGSSSKSTSYLLCKCKDLSSNSSPTKKHKQAMTGGLA
jgi:hypothetical protein